MQDKIKNLIKDTASVLGFEKGLLDSIILEHPKELSHGDYSFPIIKFVQTYLGTQRRLEKEYPNVGLKINLTSKTAPLDLAIKFKSKMEEIISGSSFPEIQKIEVAGTGFVNFYLSRKFFANSIEEILNKGNNVGKNDSLKSKKIMVEYTDPNPFKPFHIGHLMTNAIGESIARILEHSGASIARANYQGDVGLHVARAIYILLKNQKEYILKNEPLAKQASLIGKAYAEGSGAYENDEKAKKEIDEINKKIYSKNDQQINDIYDWGFKVTMGAFEDLYKMLGTKFDFYFLESQMAPIGERIVQDNLDKIIDSPGSKMIFEKSDDAIVFKAEKYDPKLHTRVFMTSQKLPTYEAKELGLIEEKFKTYPDMDLSIMVTASEQMDYMRVVTKAISLIHPNFENRMKHITHGMMRFASGKMGSRKGNVVTGESLIRDTVILVLERLKDHEWDEEEKNKIAEVVGVAALKYSILKQSTGGDIIYDFEKSISFEGDSGPYLQYSYVRANSVIEKAQKENILPDFEILPDEIFEVEKLLYKFPEIVLRSSSEYEPHYIANYLIEIARSFNSFYGNVVIVNKADKTSSYKVSLTYAFTFVMKTGLNLLGIKMPKRM